MDIYFKQHTIYRDAKKKSEYYHTIQTKLQDKIQTMIAKQKAVKLRANLLIRTWLKNFKVSSASTEIMTKQSISVDYYRLINIRLAE